MNSKMTTSPSPHLVRLYGRKKVSSTLSELQQLLDDKVLDIMNHDGPEADVAYLIRTGADMNRIIPWTGFSLLFHAINHYHPRYAALLYTSGARYIDRDYIALGGINQIRLFLRYAEPNPLLEAFVRTTVRIVAPGSTIRLLRLGVPAAAFKESDTKLFLSTSQGHLWQIAQIGQLNTIMTPALPANLVRYLQRAL